MKYLSILWILFLCVCCRPKSGADDAVSVRQTAFVYPEIPDTITDSLHRRAFLVRHFWDVYDFSDTSLLSRPDISEQGFVNYLYLLSASEREERQASIDSFIKRSDSCSLALDYFLDLTDRYLYGSASPMHDEDCYVMLASAFMKSKSVPRDKKAMLDNRIKHILKNKIGTPANNFTFVTSGGTHLLLYDVGASRLLLFFYEMGCDTCMAQIAGLRYIPAVSQKVKAGELRVLAVCLSGDEKQWKTHAQWMPGQWIMAYDEEKTISRDSLYDFKTLPSVYLLDADKKVILKDETVHGLTRYLKDANK